jgi:hypothetical protein
MAKFYLSPFLQYQTIHNLDYVQDYYVYAWLDGWKVVYLGMGTKRRAWNNHPHLTKPYSENFRVRILRHRLNKPQAHLIERHYIDHYTRRGFVLLNNRIPNNLRK